MKEKPTENMFEFNLIHVAIAPSSPERKPSFFGKNWSPEVSDTVAESASFALMIEIASAILPYTGGTS